jgi:hypothetical protein
MDGEMDAAGAPDLPSDPQVQLAEVLVQAAQPEAAQAPGEVRWHS